MTPSARATRLKTGCPRTRAAQLLGGENGVATLRRRATVKRASLLSGDAGEVTGICTFPKLTGDQRTP